MFFVFFVLWGVGQSIAPKDVLEGVEGCVGSSDPVVLPQSVSERE